MLGTLSFPAPWDALLKLYLELIQTLAEQIESLEASIEDRAGSPAETQLLMTVYSELEKIDRLD